MPPSNAQHHQARRQLQDWATRIAELWGIAPPQPELRWDLRGRCAGQCRGDRQIRLNRRLPELGETALRETLAHEYAHAVVHRLGALGCLPAIPPAAQRDWLRPHGRLWQQVMGQLGQPPRRTHDFDLAPARRVSQHRYGCDCREHLLGPVRHRRCQSGRVRYHCRACGTALRPLPVKT